MYEDVCYERPFIKEVIIRVDFAAPIEGLGKSLPSSIANIAVSIFPITEERHTVAQELQFSPKGLKHAKKEFTEWNFHGRNREKRLAIAPNCIYVTYSSYTTYEDLCTDFFSVIRVLFEEYKDVHGSRLGLRYINSIELYNHDPLNWEDIIDSGLLGMHTRFQEDRDKVTRLFNIAEFKYADDIRVKFQYGSSNPDFPAVIKRPLFVLDIDAHYDGLQSFAQIKENVARAHSHIQDLFERSITTETRRLMHAQ